MVAGSVARQHMASSSRERSTWRQRQRRPPWQSTLLDNALLVREFVTDDERRALLQKALGHFQRRQLQPNAAGPQRFFAKCDEHPAIFVDELLEKLTRRCERCLGLDGVAKDLVLGRVISLILPGGFIHRHTDQYQPGMPGYRPGYEHLRCNIVVQLPDASGRPIVEANTLPVNEGDLWAFFASKSFHQTAPLQANGDAHGDGAPRIVFGFGWSVPPNYRLRAPGPALDE